MRILDWTIGLGAVAFLGALASQSATGGLQALAYIAGPLAFAAIGWVLYVALTLGSELIDRYAAWLWRAVRAGFWTTFAAAGGAAMLFLVGWQPIGGALLFGCVLLAGGALLQALAPRG